MTPRDLYGYIIIKNTKKWGHKLSILGAEYYLHCITSIEQTVFAIHCMAMTTTLCTLLCSQDIKIRSKSQPRYNTQRNNFLVGVDNEWYILHTLFSWFCPFLQSNQFSKLQNILAGLQLGLRHISDHIWCFLLLLSSSFQFHSFVFWSNVSSFFSWFI